MTERPRRNRIDRVTTRRGDDGTTALAHGCRYPKHHPHIELVGALDEANCAIGLLVARIGEDEALLATQSRLFDAGAAVATGGSAIDWARLAEDLAAQTRVLNATLPPLREFVLPGGGDLAAAAHYARSVARRAERAWWRAVEQEPAPALRETGIGVYLNRLSDYLFVRARSFAKTERLWQPLGDG